MPRKTSPLLPATEERLRQFGERLRLARLRRQLSARQVAERAGMALMTLRSVERGGSAVTIGAYASVMQVLGLDMDIDLLAAADPVGRSLQDARLPRLRRTTPSAPVSSAGQAFSTRPQPSPKTQTPVRGDRAHTAQDTLVAPEHTEKSALTSRALADLLDVPPTHRATRKAR